MLLENKTSKFQKLTFIQVDTLTLERRESKTSSRPVDYLLQLSVAFSIRFGGYGVENIGTIVKVVFVLLTEQTVKN